MIDLLSDEVPSAKILILFFFFFQSICNFFNTRGIYEKVNNNNKYEVLVLKKGIAVAALSSAASTEHYVSISKPWPYYWIPHEALACLFFPR